MGLFLEKNQGRKKVFQPKQGQTLVEISIICALVVAVLSVMTPYIKRSIQGMIKVAADQVGNQAGAEQDFDSSFTTAMKTTASNVKQHDRSDESGNVTYTYGDSTKLSSSVEMYLGNQEKSD